MPITLHELMEARERIADLEAENKLLHEERIPGPFTDEGGSEFDSVATIMQDRRRLLRAKNEMRRQRDEAQDRIIGSLRALGFDEAADALVKS